MTFDRNLLLYGDNLQFLRDPEVFPSESVDLVYLDPPFNSDASYNVLFKEAGGQASAAQIKAFDDTWTWDDSASQALAYLMQDPHASGEVKALVTTFHGFLGHSPMLAYLVQMSVRLVHLRRVLKPTGSLYLHCDPTASHYLKLVLDGIFGPDNFQSEVIWKRTGTHSSAKRWGPIHDTVLYYSKQAGLHTWHRPYVPHDPKHLERHYQRRDAQGRRYEHGELTAPGVRNGRSGAKWRGFDVTSLGRHWITTVERLDELHAQGRVYLPTDGSWPRLIRFMDESKGRAIGDVFVDIAPLNMVAKERLGYPTQKPVALLRRLIAASSNPGDVVFDPFCGCGSTIDAVETLNRENPGQPPRRWIGIDITHLAINLIKSRLARFDPPAVYRVLGEPVDEAGARALFEQDPHQFQYWACGLVAARPLGGAKQAKKGADRGIDGSRYFVDDNTGPKAILVQVKGGKVGAKDVRDFRGVLEREKAALGIFISLAEPTKPMREEAATARPYTNAKSGTASVPGLQLVTIRQLLAGGSPSQPAGVILPRGVDQASTDRTFKKAKRHDAGGLFGS